MTALHPPARRTNSGYKADPGTAQSAEITRIEELGGEPAECPACGFLGFANSRDDRGVLFVHPGRAWPCRVSNVPEATS